MIFPAQGSSTSDPRCLMGEAFDVSFEGAELENDVALVEVATPDCLNYLQAGLARRPISAMRCESEPLSCY